MSLARKYVALVKNLIYEQKRGNGYHNAVIGLTCKLAI